MTNIFDTHAHYASRQFDGDRADLLAALSGAAWWVCWNVPPTPATPKRCWNWRTPCLTSTPRWASTRKASSRRTPPPWPSTTADWRAELAAMRPLYEDPAVVAVGEIGLDHHWPVPREEQYALFETQLQLARELDLPVSVHDREAHAEMYDLLQI